MTEGRARTLRQHRMLAGLTIRELSQRIKETSGKAMSTRTLVRIEDGQSAHVRSFRRIADALGVAPTDIQEFRDLVEEAGQPDEDELPDPTRPDDAMSFEEFKDYIVHSDAETKLGAMLVSVLFQQRFQKQGGLDPTNERYRPEEHFDRLLDWMQREAEFEIVDVPREDESNDFTFTVQVKSMTDKLRKAVEEAFSMADDTPTDEP